MKNVRQGLLPLVALALWVASAVAQTDRVRLVLFFAQTCPHCHEVIQNHLPGLFETHGGVPETQLAWGASEEEIAAYYLVNERIELLLIDVATPAGNDLYAASAEAFSIPPDRRGVPRLIIGDTVLVGSLEIPMHLPGMVDEGLAAGGIDWPDIPGLEPVVANFVAESQRLGALGADEAEVAGDSPAPVDSAATSLEATPSPTNESDKPPQPEVEETEPAREEAAQPNKPEPDNPGPVEAELAAASRVEVDTAADAPAEHAAVDTSGSEPTGPRAPQPTILESLPESRPSAIENFRHDPVGNGASVVVLIGMLLCVAAVLVHPRFRASGEALSPLVLVLAVVGIVVAGYLAYIEMTRTLAVCGPVGDCNTVQQSEYARLFGLIPVGVVGLLGYAVIVVAWWVSRFGDSQGADVARASAFVVSFVGTLFSIYLTYLEPFVIGATCAWCLTSSVVITAMMVLSAGPGVEAWSRLRSTDTAH